MGEELGLPAYSPVCTCTQVPYLPRCAAGHHSWSRNHEYSTEVWKQLKILKEKLLASYFHSVALFGLPLFQRKDTIGIVEVFDDGVELVGASALTGGAKRGGGREDGIEDGMGKSSISIGISRLGPFSSPVLNLERDLL